MPVVGGYLAFIGYFCLMAGVALCIGKNMTQLSDWTYLLDTKLFVLAFPGLVSGLLLSLISRYSTNNDVLFPLIMVLIPISFYCILYWFNISMNDARQYGWIGPESGSNSSNSSGGTSTSLWSLCNFSLVRWDLLIDIFPTWFGMVFVVSFASCLDVAAISMDMGQPLDTNKELITVGICNSK
jgi:sulfate permease, SulP family